MNTKGLVFTSAPESADNALKELRSMFPHARFVDWLAPGVGLLDSDGAFKSVHAKAKGGNMLFVRHICPHQGDMGLSGTPGDIMDLTGACRAVVPEGPGRASVQTRIFATTDPPYARFDLNQALAAVLGENGWTVDVREPEHALSVVLSDSAGTLRAWFGFSPVKHNLSDWAGGEMRFRMEPERISRAEFKLLEAFNAFGLTPPEGGNALDLGAAPGGWTRVLRAKGLSVAAVDPALMDPRIMSDPGVVHHRMTSQEFLPRQERYDVIVNDMRMDARDSSRIMGEVSGCLAPGGFAIITLKLPEENQANTSKQALELLRKWYTVIDARQLFHNRSEVTVVLGGKE